MDIPQGRPPVAAQIQGRHRDLPPRIQPTSSYHPYPSHPSSLPAGQPGATFSSDFSFMTGMPATATFQLRFRVDQITAGSGNLVPAHNSGENLQIVSDPARRPSRHGAQTCPASFLPRPLSACRCPSRQLPERRARLQAVSSARQ